MMTRHTASRPHSLARRGLVAVLMFVCASVLYLASTPLPRVAPTPDTPGWIGPVAVIDPVEGGILRDRAIAVDDGRISAVLPVADLPEHARRMMVAAAGAYALPGLWDMHALLTRYAPAIEHPLYLSHGVTRVRNILNCPADDALNLHPCRAAKQAWNAEIEAGEMVGPLIMGSGTYPVAGSQHRHRDAPDAFSAATPAQAVVLARWLAGRLGDSDHIKTYDGLPRDSFFALMEEARRLGLEVSGHVPAAVTVREAAAAGLKAVAHARVLPIGCSSREAEVMRLRVAGARAAEWMALALESYDEATCAALWETLRRHGTFLSPTLITRFNETRAGLAELRADPLTVAVTPSLVKLIWREDTAAIDSRTEADETVYRRYYEASAARTAEAARAGVRLILGSDTNDVYVAPGVGLHQEIELWRRAGMSPDAILQATTSHAAAYFERQDRFGRIAEGFAADIVFVDRNPLADLSTLREPLAVMQQGRLYDRAGLQRARAEATAAASGWRYGVHFARDLLRNPLGFVN